MPRERKQRRNSGARRPDGMPVGSPWKAGQSGNLKGRPISKPLTEALKAALSKNDGAAIQELVAVAVKKAKAGDFRFWKEVMDRVDGRPTDRVEVAGDPVAMMGPGYVASIEKIEKLLVEGPARAYHPEYKAPKGSGEEQSHG